MSGPSVSLSLFARSVNRIERCALVFVAAVAVGAIAYVGVETVRFQVNPFSYGHLMDWVLLALFAVALSVPSLVAVCLAAVLVQRLRSHFVQGSMLAACAFATYLWATNSPEVFSLSKVVFSELLAELAFSVVLGFGWAFKVHAAPLTWPSWLRAVRT